MQMLQEGRLHGRPFLQYRFVGEAQDPVAHFFEDILPELVVFELLAVDLAVDFDDEFGFVAVEVGDEEAFSALFFGMLDDMLPVKFPPKQLSVSDFLPEEILCRRSVFSKVPGKCHYLFVRHFFRL